MACHAPGVDGCCVPTMGMIVLAQQWIPNYGPADSFTLHGLWPDTCKGGNGPRNGCDKDSEYPSISSLVPAATLEQMNTYWPSYKDDNDLFWVHEWTTHGTCVSTLEPRCFGDDYQQGQEVADYFGLGLTLRARYDLYAALNDAGITPGGTYGVEQMVQAVKSKFGVEPQIQCGKDDSLSEIHLYFSVRGRSDYEVMDAVKPGGSGCKGNQVGYPVKYSGDGNSGDGN